MRVRSSEIGKGLLGLSCQFDRDGHLDFMFIRGTLNRYLQRRALREEIDRHPEWSDPQLDRWLHQRGMQFGPEEEKTFLVSVLPSLEQLASALGGVSRNVRPTFELRVETFNDPTERKAEVDWSVELEVAPTLRGRAPTKYALEFEPMGGKLQSIIKID